MKYQAPESFGLGDAITKAGGIPLSYDQPVIDLNCISGVYDVSHLIKGSGRSWALFTHFLGGVAANSWGGTELTREMMEGALGPLPDSLRIMAMTMSLVGTVTPGNFTRGSAMLVPSNIDVGISTVRLSYYTAAGAAPEVSPFQLRVPFDWPLNQRLAIGALSSGTGGIGGDVAVVLFLTEGSAGEAVSGVIL